MRTHSYVFGSIIFFLVFAAMGSLFMGANNIPATVAPTPEVSPILVPEVVTTAPLAIPESTDPMKSMIIVSVPQPDTKVTSPLEVTGLARGQWYFEASFPIKLIDTNGNTIVQTHAEAQGEWMTENFVPFTSILTWSSTSTTATSGILILMRDNPSGLPENDAEIRVPVLF